MSRRKRIPEHPNHERWLVSYADFITLLFAFFVVLYSTAQVDKRKAGQVAQAIQAAFQQLGVFESSNKKLPMSESEAMPLEKVQAVENIVRSADYRQLAPPMEGVPNNGALPKSMKDIRGELEKALAPEIQRGEVELQVRREGLVVSLREAGFFDSGSATLRIGSEEAVSRLAAVLISRTEPIRVEGHTDTVPIHTSRFTSNWELSTARATEMIRLFITRYGFQSPRLSAAGYAEFHPSVGNNTPEGRARNRRVDIVVLSPMVFLKPDPPGAAADPKLSQPPPGPNK